MENLKQNTTGVWSGLPTWAKGVIAVAVTGTVIFIGYKVYKTLNKTEQEKEDEKRRKESAKDQEKQSEKEAIKVNPSYSNSQYLSFADSIFNELNGCGAGRADVVERALMAMKNDLDVSKLISAYGTRQRTCLKVDTGGKDGLLTSLADEWTALYNRSRNKVNNDWANKHIKYRV